jgi:hypothetical protein
MAKCMSNVVFIATKVAIHKVNFIFVSCNEVTNIDNQSSILVHVYVFEDFKRIPILVNLKCVTKGASTNNLTTMFKNFVAKFKQPLNYDMTMKIVCFNANGASTFQSIKIGVSI